MDVTGGPKRRARGRIQARNDLGREPHGAGPKPRAGREHLGC
jgi:hypothetical protein